MEQQIVMHLTPAEFKQLIKEGIREAEQEKAEQLNKILDDENLLVSPKDSLSEIVGDINYLLTEWAKSTGFGANFEWRYTPEGIKELHIRDVAPIKSLPKDQAAVAVAEVQKVMEKLDGE